MNIIKYPTDEAVDGAMKADEPILAAVSFDGSTAVMCPVDEAGEHHILLMETGFKDTDIDRFFRIVLDKSSADWTFVCPPDIDKYEYYLRGFSKLSEFTDSIGYNVGISIPQRYLK